MSYVDEVFDMVVAKNPAQPEFHQAVKEVLEKTPPELAGDIMNRGIVMTGGGSLLHGLDTLVSERTGLPTYIPEDAVSCVAIGTGLALQNIDVLQGTKKKELI